MGSLHSLFWHVMKLFPMIAPFIIFAGCGRGPQHPSKSSAEQHSSRRQERVDTRPIIAAFGNSLSAGHGVAPGQSYPDYLQRELDRRGYAYRVVNAGLGGDTTTSGLVRVGDVVALRPAIVVLEFGANDGLRGIPIQASESSLEQLILTLRKTGTEVVLAGMTLPPNYGPDYIQSFERMYTTLAAKYKLPLIPFLLEGVGGHSDLMQQDALHPTAEGNRRVAANVMRILEPMLSRPESSSDSAGTAGATPHRLRRP